MVSAMLRFAIEREPHLEDRQLSVSLMCGTPSLPFGRREEVPQGVEAGSSSANRRFVMQEAVPQLPARLLLPRPIRVLEPLAHLLEGGCIDVASRIPLTQDL